MVFVTFTQGLEATRSTDARTNDGAHARLALADASKLLRTAVDPDGLGGHVAVDLATPTEIVFFAAVGSKGTTVTDDRYPFKARIWLDPVTETLIEQRFEPVVTVVNGIESPSWDIPGPNHIIARSVVLPQPGPIFTYLAENDFDVGADGRAISSLLRDGAGDVTDIDERVKIRGIEMWISLNSAPNKRAEATTAVSRVTLLNRA